MDLLLRNKRIWVLTAMFAITAILSTCTAPIWAYNTLILRHRRAMMRWSQRQPYHYSYQITLSSSFMYRKYLIEVMNTEIISVKDSKTLAEVKFTLTSGHSNWAGYQILATHLSIDDIFSHIRISAVEPHSVKALFGRSNQDLYAMMVDSGLVSDGWQACQPGYPKVHYNRTLGYPEQLSLFGDPCSVNVEENSPIKIKIESFQILP